MNICIYLHFPAIFRIIVKTRSSVKITNYNNGSISDKEEVNLSDPVSDRLSNATSLEGDRYKGNFVSLMLLICLSETLLKMKFLSSQKVFSLFLLLNILIKHCSEKNLNILVGN